MNDKTGISAGLIEARYPCEQCNMDDGSPVCLQDMRCPKRSQRTNDKTDTEPLATALGILAQEASQRDDHGDAEILAKASLRLHDKSEEIERLKAEISVLKDAVHYANGTAELAIRHRDEAEALVAALRGALSDEIALAIQHSRNFATAKPDIGPTEREHILGMCMLLADVMSHYGLGASTNKGDPQCSE